MSGVRMKLCLLVVVSVTMAGGCINPPPRTGPGSTVVEETPPQPAAGVRPGDLLPRRGDEISACGQLFHTGTRVVLWNDPGGYDAYRAHRHLDEANPAPTRNKDATVRFGTFRRNLPPALAARVMAEGWALEDLQEVVDQVVLHYDACGTSHRCFEVLHDIRGLSCHFLLDLDGTIYQTLDVKERAWHAGSSNDRSVGIEIASPGARTRLSELDLWYKDDEAGVRLELPEELRDHAPTGFVPRPARVRPVLGRVQGRDLLQYDFTPEQYDALSLLLATLCRILPRIEPEAPRDAAGNVRDAVLDEAEIAAFSGLVGHYHVSRLKDDPGPAFDWPRVIENLRRILED